jgi:hypothetical protein
MKEQEPHSKELVKFITETLRETKEFALEQSPDVVQQYLSSKVTSSGLGVLFTFIGCVISVILIRKGILISRAKSGFYSDDDFLYYLFGGTLGICSILFLITNIFSLVNVYFYPKAYLLERFLL